MNSRLLIAVGLPSQNSGVDYEPTHVQGRTITIPCDYMAASTKVRGFHSVRLKAIPEMGAWPVDGLSGGAIFSVDGSPANYSANLRGIILRGGVETLHYLDIQAVIHMAEKSVLPLDPS